MDVSHIGRVPREPVVPIAGMGERFEILPVIDVSPTVEEIAVESVCTELIGWQKPYLMLCMAFQHYIQEHTIADGRDPKRITIVAKHSFRILGPEIDVTKIDRPLSRHYAAVRRSEGAVNATIRRELAIVHAVIAHNATEGRIKDSEVPKFVLPKAGDPRTRWLTRDEHRRLMQQPMEHRIRMFLLLAFGAGARSHAIEELTWDRINWEMRTVDFRVPGVVYRNKKRVIAPLGDVLYRRLEFAFQRRDPSDPFVIGRGGCTYRKVKKVLAAIGITERGVARHVARHTFCSWLVQQDVSYAKIGALVGDKAAMIEKVYGHLAPDHTRSAVNLALVA